jgi:hypothetical protein
MPNILVAIAGEIDQPVRSNAKAAPTSFAGSGTANSLAPGPGYLQQSDGAFTELYRPNDDVDELVTIAGIVELDRRHRLLR